MDPYPACLPEYGGNLYSLHTSVCTCDVRFYPSSSRSCRLYQGSRLPCALLTSPLSLSFPGCYDLQRWRGSKERGGRIWITLYLT
eukprot:125688-Amorphochlora_amoeboformis.AAC.1